MAAGKQCFLLFRPTISPAKLMLSNSPVPPPKSAPGTAIGIVKDKNCTPRFLFTSVAELLY